MFSYHPLYFDFHSTRAIFDVSSTSGFLARRSVQHLVFTFDVFCSAETTCTARWHVFYIRNRHISVSSFVYKYDQWPHDSHMTGRTGVWEADDIVQFYIALLDFFPPSKVNTRCCTLRRAKNTPTCSFVSRTVNRK
jgi:hypothetical protein